ncbi:FtsB family cell division protein [Aquibacillus salsiterrae]|uniref:Septum formation initiator family protein n=1 Tax=Aquibacillus salsiterrae TaxID=2950439 RepID=A0A9X3WGC1_9BACI|nr:septum formation initiator family protein [Aquibacillus salsiterrae]MDC3417921.1 septum formation initiator family protein [Aquibacillus salsiterrae]
MTRKERKVAKIDSSYMDQYDAYMQRQLKKKKRLLRRLVLFSFIVFLTIGSITTYHLKQRNLYADKQGQYESLQKELAVLKSEEKDLQEEVKLLNDEEYVLQIAKTNYFFTEKGEIVFKLPDEDPSY